MAQPQNNVSITAPGFAGLNTQDSPLDMDQSFASVADNCVIDNFGRIASRRGFQAYTKNPSVLNDNPIETIEEFVTDTGLSYLFACGNEAIYIQQQAAPYELVALTLPNVPTANNWKIVPFNEKCYFVQANHAPLVFDPLVSTVALQEWAEVPNGTSYPNECHAAFGRLWCSDFDSAPTVVFWSGLLDGENWTDLGTGSLNTEEYWPSGFDQVTALAAHNNFMVVFGNTNILLYQTTPDVNNTISLVDTIEGIGCIARDSVVPTGSDYFFLDATGVRMLGRTIQEKSVPLGDISRNVRTEFQQSLRLGSTGDIRGVYHVEDNFYTCFVPSNPKTYVFDTWNPLPQGAARATVWPGLNIRGGVRLLSRMTLFCGRGGVYEYTGSEDIQVVSEGPVVEESQSIPMQYFTHPMDFGSPANLIFPKQVDVTLIGGLLGQLTLEWGYDYGIPDKFKTKDIGGSALPSFWYDYGQVPASDPPEYLPSPDYPEPTTMAEWSDPENFPAQAGQIGYWTTGQTINQLKYNIWGSGRNVKVGFNADIQGSTISIQELNIQVLQGRIL